MLGGTHWEKLLEEWYFSMNWTNLTGREQNFRLRPLITSWNFCYRFGLPNTSSIDLQTKVSKFNAELNKRQNQDIIAVGISQIFQDFMHNSKDQCHLEKSGENSRKQPLAGLTSWMKKETPHKKAHTFGKILILQLSFLIWRYFLLLSLSIVCGWPVWKGLWLLVVRISVVNA